MKRIAAVTAIIGLAALCSASSICFSGQAPYAPVIDPADFVDVIDNQYFPLMPGTTFIYEGETDEGFERVETYVTHETKEILGVTCTVVRDRETIDGELIEETFDWYAQDRHGNVWYFGEDATIYEDGVPVSKEGSWEAGVEDALPGIIMFGEPRKGRSYRQEYAPDIAEDMAKVLNLNKSACVPFGCFEDLLMTKEWTPLEPGSIEHKYYAPGVGLVYIEELKEKTVEVELVEIID